MQRNGRKEVTLKRANLPPEGEEECSMMQKDIDTEDESFNPEAVGVKHTRPEMRKYPKISLPYS